MLKLETRDEAHQTCPVTLGKKTGGRGWGREGVYLQVYPIQLKVMEVVSYFLTLSQQPVWMASLSTPR